ncbi:GNAT family N-acetyltransferase [Bacillus sp. T33-2]|uniref:GNAT family N-acetyltransferase n=1 Tax=Bacillus sp. T33-2 TaxID=2054168 RepID=UPI000C788FB3|nr:GNAT family protein [Bacillus sp. T33-2]PLR99256.1 GNAT family N-acetyltransferase [Bacillus sp. T33-2]
MEKQSEKFLQGRRVYLRPYRPEDLDFFYEGLYIFEARELTGLKRVYNKEFMADYLGKIAKDESRIFLVIVDNETNELIGDVELNYIDLLNRTSYIRIQISNSDYLSKGYGTEAMRLLLDYGFGVYNLHRIELEVYSYNARAIRAYEKLGFKQEGIKRESIYYNHKFHDTIIMGMLKSEFQRVHNIEGDLE